ncbi:hypothetical protein MLD38_014657 [Melastoma candidum]|uniref:Uncharacterized protein n=1 Tax=Melastoma candidum TaxID=119954 RepID=A0ACB9RGK7_9MYRT|nr:hypothetical protein MLD38_014657 [Melastoma candidum]
MLDPTKLVEEKMKAFTYLAFPNSSHPVLNKGTPQSENDDETEQGLVTSVTCGIMSVSRTWASCEQIAVQFSPMEPSASTP